MADNGTKFLCQAGLIHCGATFALNVSRHGHQSGNGEYTGATHACDHCIPGPIQGWQHGLGQRIKHRLTDTATNGGLAQSATNYRHKTRAKPIGTAVILVTGILVNFSLAAQLGLLRQYGQTIGFNAAVAAAFTDRVVYKQTLGGINKDALFPSAALLRRTGLLIDDY